MFRGTTKITLDDKGRMVMPTRYRDQIAGLAQGRLVVTVDKDQCLLIYPLPEWEQIERKLMSLPSLNPLPRPLLPLMGRHAPHLPFRGPGRGPLPPELREFAKLGRPGIPNRPGNRFEL